MTDNEMLDHGRRLSERTVGSALEVVVEDQRVLFRYTRKSAISCLVTICIAAVVLLAIMIWSRMASWTVPVPLLSGGGLFVIGLLIGSIDFLLCQYDTRSRDTLNMAFTYMTRNGSLERVPYGDLPGDAGNVLMMLGYVCKKRVLKVVWRQNGPDFYDGPGAGRLNVQKLLAQATVLYDPSDPDTSWVDKIQ
jgi:hypothetical protein